MKASNVRLTAVRVARQASWSLRRYARVFFRLPQICIEHQLAERFFE
jgi:hypothetical protein